MLAATANNLYVWTSYFFIQLRHTTQKTKREKTMKNTTSENQKNLANFYAAHRAVDALHSYAREYNRAVEYYHFDGSNSTSGLTSYELTDVDAFLDTDDLHKVEVCDAGTDDWSVAIYADNSYVVFNAADHSDDGLFVDDECVLHSSYENDKRPSFAIRISASGGDTINDGLRAVVEKEFGNVFDFDCDTWIDFLKGIDQVIELDDRYDGTYYVPKIGRVDSIISLLRDFQDWDRLQ